MIGKIKNIGKWILIIWAWFGMINSAIRLFMLLTGAWPETSYDFFVGVSVFLLSLFILNKTGQFKYIKREYERKS